ncbi:hypothetical protein LTS18_001501, partial [Coniosporium uncinatum]
MVHPAYYQISSNGQGHTPWDFEGSAYSSQPTPTYEMEQFHFDSPVIYTPGRTVDARVE